MDFQTILLIVLLCCMWALVAVCGRVAVTLWWSPYRRTRANLDARKQNN